MWWVLTPILVIAYLVFGAYLGKRFITSASGKKELDDVADVVLVGLIAIAGPAVLPFGLVIYGLGKLGCRLVGLKMKKEKTE